MINLHEPQFDAADEAMVLETLRSSWVSTGGPFVDKFEKVFAEYVGSRFATSVMNGTCALQLGLETLARIKEITTTFEVIVPTLTFIATANSVVHAGGLPVFADCAEGSMNISPQAVYEFITSQYEFNSNKKMWFSKRSQLPLLAVMPAHIMGWSCDMAKLKSLCHELNIDIFEDAAESLGTVNVGGTHSGRVGIAGGFSFNGNKILTTGGGGMLVTDNEAFFKRAKHISTTAKTDGLRFVHDEVGYNFRLVSILAALGISQLEKLPARLKRKKEIFDIYSQELAGTEAKVHSEEFVQSNNWLVTILLKNESQREKTLQTLVKENIQARPLWTMTHLQPAFKNHFQSTFDFHNATDMWKRALSLPSSPQLSNDIIKSIAKVIKQSL